MNSNTDGSIAAAKTGVNLRSGVVRAALASGFTESLNRILAIVLSIATARALLPDQVGLLGLAVIIAGIVSLIAACSETAGVIDRNKGDDAQHAFAATIIRGFIVVLLIAVVLVVSSAITGLLTENEAGRSELGRLLRILLWLPVLELTACYPRVLLQRRLDLTYLAGVGSLQVCLHVSLSIGLLLKGAGAPGVAWSSVIASAMTVVMVWLRLVFAQGQQWQGFPRRSLWSSVLTQASKVFAGSFLGYLNGRADNLLVAGAIGPMAMGLYSMAWSASRVVPQILDQAFAFVLVPTFSKIHSDTERISRALKESLFHAYLLLAPVSALLFVLAPDVVEIVLGSKWLGMVTCLRVMCVTILASPLISASNVSLVSSGKAHMAGLATMGQLAVLAGLIVPLSHRIGIVGAAIGDLFAVLALTALLLAATPSTRTLLRASCRQLVVPLSAALLAAACAFTSALTISGSVLRACGATLAFVTVYPAFLSLFGGLKVLTQLVSILRIATRRATATT